MHHRYVLKLVVAVSPYFLPKMSFRKLNNLTDIRNHPIKDYLKNNIRCVQGTDGCGFYGIDTIDEQIAWRNLLDVTEEEFENLLDTAEDEGVIDENETELLQSALEFTDLDAGDSGAV